MKWKTGVKVIKTPGFALQLGEILRPVPEKDVYLVKAMEQGITDDEWLMRLIMKTEQIGETAAAFGLAQFLIDFGDFIAADTGHYVITN